MIYELVFSATGRCQRVLDIVSSPWEDERIRIDLSDRNFNPGRYKFEKDDLCFLAVSVYEGRIPSPAAEKLKMLTGNGAKVILLAVFGNRAIDDCLMEMREMMIKQGFVPVAALEASVQHSILPKVAPTRPDEADIAELTAFGQQIREHLATQDHFGTLSVPGQVPTKAPGGLPYRPKANNKCVGCGLCAQKCPTGAIPLDNPAATDKNKCITCMRCATICPVDARKSPAWLEFAFTAAMWKVFKERKPNKLYL